MPAPDRSYIHSMIMGMSLWLEEKMAWSYQTFGRGARSQGVLKHIELEIKECRRNPHDVEEWIDIILLALDGACRAGFTPLEVVTALINKQNRNTHRHWNPPGDQDQPVFHQEEIEEEPREGLSLFTTIKHRWWDFKRWLRT